MDTQSNMEAQGDSAAEELEVRMATVAELEAQTLPQQLELLTPAVAVAELTQKISTREPVDPE
jgi:hypothetical protein